MTLVDVFDLSQINYFIFHCQCFVAVLLMAALTQAVPVEYGHYAAPALIHHAPVYAHAPIKHVIAEPDVSVHHAWLFVK